MGSPGGEVSPIRVGLQESEFVKSVETFRVSSMGGSDKGVKDEFVGK